MSILDSRLTRSAASAPAEPKYGGLRIANADEHGRNVGFDEHRATTPLDMRQGWLYDRVRERVSVTDGPMGTLLSRCSAILMILPWPYVTSSFAHGRTVGTVGIEGRVEVGDQGDDPTDRDSSGGVPRRSLSKSLRELRQILSQEPTSDLEESKEVAPELQKAEESTAELESRFFNRWERPMWHDSYRTAVDYCDARDFSYLEANRRYRQRKNSAGKKDKGALEQMREALKSELDEARELLTELERSDAESQKLRSQQQQLRDQTHDNAAKAAELEKSLAGLKGPASATGDIQAQMCQKCNETGRIVECSICRDHLIRRRELLRDEGRRLQREIESLGRRIGDMERDIEGLMEKVQGVGGRINEDAVKLVQRILDTRSLWQCNKVIRVARRFRAARAAGSVWKFDGQGFVQGDIGLGMSLCPDKIRACSRSGIRPGSQFMGSLAFLWSPLEERFSLVIKETFMGGRMSETNGPRRNTRSWVSTLGVRVTVRDDGIFGFGLGLDFGHAWQEYRWRRSSFFVTNFLRLDSHTSQDASRRVGVHSAALVPSAYLRFGKVANIRAGALFPVLSEYNQSLGVSLFPAVLISAELVLGDVILGFY